MGKTNTTYRTELVVVVSRRGKFCVQLITLDEIGLYLDVVNIRSPTLLVDNAPITERQDGQALVERLAHVEL